MKTVVLYKSATGFTKKYAEWIADELSADIYPASKVNLRNLLPYDCIVFGGRIHAEGIDGISLIKKNFDQLKGKRLIVFATGATPTNEVDLQELINKNLTIPQQNPVDFYYFRGGFNFKALPVLDKFMMSMYRRSIISKQKSGKPLTAQEAGMRTLFDTVSDFTSKENIRDLVQAARNV